MNFGLSEDLIILRDAIRKFAEDEIAPHAMELDREEKFSVDITQKMGEMGLFGMYVPAEYGGQGMDALSYVIAMEELARVDGSQAATVTAHNSIGVGPILGFGTEEQKQKYLPKMCSGEMLWGFGLTEANAGSDSRGTQTTAKKDGDEWVISGSKIFITNVSNPLAGGLTVQAKTGEKDGKPELTCFLVEKDAPGLSVKTMHGKLMWRASDTAEVYLDNVRVKADAVIGEIGKGSSQMLTALDAGRLGIAAMGLGAAQGAFEKAVAYSKERKQFGKSICKFQGISFKLADMAMEIDVARSYLYQAARMKDAGVPFTKEASIAKLYCTEVAGRVTDWAIQVHGGYGLMQEYDVERFWRDQRILQIGEGSSEVQRIIIARQLGC
ncbi:MAG: acyl-CoA dehydrogenase family protein [Alphaproteobacteria bacterium]|nr:acyl-CoA dehydrogenase family protein [Alphaproteobacteria bacterium]